MSEFGSDPEQESKHYPLEIMILSVVMLLSVVFYYQHLIDSSTSIVISSLVILYGAFGIYRG